jgi:hypothetical protein
MLRFQFFLFLLLPWMASAGPIFRWLSPCTIGSTGVNGSCVGAATGVIAVIPPGSRRSISGNLPTLSFLNQDASLSVLFVPSFAMDGFGWSDLSLGTIGSTGVNGSCVGAATGVIAVIPPGSRRSISGFAFSSFCSFFCHGWLRLVRSFAGCLRHWSHLSRVLLAPRA